MKFKINKLPKLSQMKDLEVSFIACVVVLLVSEEGKWFSCLVCGEVTNKSQTSLPYGKMSVCVCVHASHSHVTEPHGRHI